MCKEISLYIHIPFCEKKCYYCDFSSYVGVGEGRIERYIDAVIKEISFYEDDLKEYNIKSIFLGGGTPSSINAIYIERILNYIKCNLNLDENIEITIEANPNSINTQNLNLYRESGVNRISMGLQSTDDEILRRIGRIHTYEDFLKSYNTVVNSGIDNINVDLIFGIPGQTTETIKKDLDKILKLDIDHISYYSLILEGDTPMEKWVEEGKYNMPEEEEDRKMYHYIVERLKESGYNHYEISNFGKKSKECYHNIVYWKIKPYLGFGLSSHSYFENTRFYNTSEMNEYLDNIENNKKAIVEKEEITTNDEISEYCIFGLRLIDGIDEEEFMDRFNNPIDYYYKDIIDKHILDGLIKRENKKIFLTKKGLDLANLVEVDFLL